MVDGMCVCVCVAKPIVRERERDRGIPLFGVRPDELITTVVYESMHSW